MKRNKHLIILLGTLISLIGQGFVAQENVVLSVKGNRDIEPAYRITKQPKLIDTVIPYSEIQYPLLSLKYESSFALDTIKAAKIKLIDKLPDLYHSYVKVGVGSKFMPLAEVYYNNVRSRKYLYGAHLKHLSSFGNIPNYAPSQFDRTNLDFSGKINENKYTLAGNVHFSSLGLHQYGIRNEKTPKDSIAQRFTDVGFGASYSKHKKDTLHLNYLVGLNYNHYQDKNPKVDSLNTWFARENFVALNGSLWYKIGKEILKTDAKLLYNTYKYGSEGDSLSSIDTALVSNNFIFKLEPSITTYAKNNRLKVKFGADVALDAQKNNDQGKSKIYVYPNIELKYSMFEDILIPYLNINGGLKQNTFKVLSQENEFLLSNQQLRNENKVVNATLGLKGTLSSKIMFNVHASFGIYKNKALFVTDTLYARGNQFRVIYDNINIATISGSISYQLAEKIKVEGIGTFNSYQCKNNSFAWNLPQLQVIARGSYQVLDQLRLKLEANLEGGRFAQVYTKADSDHEENLQFAKQLGFIPDLNFGAEYRYSEKLSAFLDFNNFVAQRYNRWYNYPTMGFQVMGGVTFRF